MKRIKVKLGDVFQINLPNGKYAYGRVYKDATVGIYNKITDKPLNPPIGFRDFMFFVGLYSDILKKGKWEIIGNDPFLNEEEAWPPKKFIYDVINKAYSIYFRGQIIPANKEECVGLESASVWDLHHVIDRIMGDNKWTKTCE